MTPIENISFEVQNTLREYIGIRTLISKLLTTQQAAEYLNVSAAFLNRDRIENARIPYVKLGTRTIRYRLEELDVYIEGNIQGYSVET